MIHQCQLHTAVSKTVIYSQKQDFKSLHNNFARSLHMGPASLLAFTVYLSIVIHVAL